jgi:hypothetical protein
VDRDQIQRGDTVMVEVAGEKEEVIPRLAKTAGGMPEMADAGTTCLMPGFQVPCALGAGRRKRLPNRQYLEGRDDKFIHFKEGEMHSKDMNTIDREKVGQHPLFF